MGGALQRDRKMKLLGRLSLKILQSQKLQCLLSMDRASREEEADPGDSTSNVSLSQGMSNVHQSPICEIQNEY